MRIRYGFSVRFPYLVAETDGPARMEYAVLSTNDPVDRRAIKHIIRKWVKVNLGRSLDPYTQYALMKSVVRHHQPRFNQIIRERRLATDIEIKAHASANR